MAAPTIESIVDTDDGQTNFNHTADLPSTIDAGWLLLAWTGANENGGTTWDSATDSTSDSWTKIGPLTDPSHIWGEFWAKVADGDEDGGTLTWVTNHNRAGCASIHAISGWSGDLDDIEFDETAHTDTQNPNPPSHTPSGGSADYLYLCGWFGGNDDATVTAVPSGYTSGGYGQGGVDSNASVEVATAYKQTTSSSSEDPGTWTLSEVEGLNAITMSIPPAAGGGGTAVKDIIGIGMIPFAR